MQRQLLILKILKVPVRIIKEGSKLMAILTYLPNYIIIRIIDQFLFNPKIDSTLFKYSIFWIIRIILLNLLILLFGSEVYFAYALLDMSKHSLQIQIVAMIFLTSISLMLMRGGYLMFIKMFNPYKLKSPIEHLVLYGQYFADILGIVVGLLNLILVVNIHRTLSYEYRANQRRYLKHIFRLLRESILIYINFFYIKVFFRLFQWRYLNQIKDVEKEKQNVLQFFVLLTLLWFKTSIDLCFIVPIGWIPLLHPKRSKYYSMFDPLKDCSYWKIVLKFNLFIIIQIIEILLLMICVVRPKRFWKLLKQVVKQSELSQIHLSRVFLLVFLSFLVIPYLICLFIILMSDYKYRKYRKTIDNDNDFSVIPQFLAFKLTLQLLLECAILPFIVVSTIIKPWNYFWINYLITQDYNLNGTRIFEYFFKSILDIVLCFVGIIASVIILIYNPSQVVKLVRHYLQEHSKMSELQVIDGVSTMGTMCSNMLFKIRTDIPNLGMYLVLRISPLWLLSGSQPNKSGHSIQQIMMWSYQQWAKRSKQYNLYLQMFQKDMAAGLLKNDADKLQFWKIVSACTRFTNIIAILKFILPSRKVKKVIERSDSNPSSLVTNYSCISNKYWNTRRHLYVLIGLMFYLIIEFILTLVGVFILLPFTLWRLPTFIIVFIKYPKKQLFFKTVFAMHYQLFRDVMMFLVHLSAFIIAPRYYIKFRWNNCFYYGEDGINTFKATQAIKQTILFEILQQSIYRYSILTEAMTIFLMWIRLSHYRKLRVNGLSHFKIFIDLEIPTARQLKQKTLIQYKNNSQKLNKLKQAGQISKQVFLMAIADIPYLAVLFVLLIIMPWRIFYVIEVLKQFHQGVDNRKKFRVLVKESLKDYLCILMNIILILSIVKAKRSLRLILKNYRLNFFVGFLEYSYFEELKKQIFQAICFYHNIIILLFAILFNFPEALNIVKRIYIIYKKQKQEEESRQANDNIHQNTIKEGKDQKIISKMGYNCFMTMCSYLETGQIANLSVLNKLTYKMVKSGEIWMVRWEKSYQSKYGQSIKGEDYEKMCIQAYQREKSLRVGGKPIKQTLTSACLSQLYQNVKNSNVQTRVVLSLVLPQRAVRYLFTDFVYHLQEGYHQGAVEEIDREREIRRILGEPQPAQQIAHQLNQLEFFPNWIIFRPVQSLLSKPNQYLSVNGNRRIKQLLFALTIIFFCVSYLCIVYFYFFDFWVLSNLIGIKILLTIYFHLIIFQFVNRANYQYWHSWDSLKPFDLINDIRNLIGFLWNKVIVGSVKFVTKYMVVKPSKFVWSKIFSPILNFISKVIQKLLNFALSSLKFARDEVALPVYLFISDLIRKGFNLLISLLKLIKSGIMSVLYAIQMLFINTFKVVRTIFSNINNLYRFVLQKSLIFWLRFGSIGQLIFTVLALGLMILPFLSWWFLYSERWYLFVSIIWSLSSIVSGYKHLSDVKKNL